jgi:primase-polymerase (primpol)-like protein
LADGIGFVLGGSDYGALDLNHCRDRKTGKIDEWAQEWLDKAGGAYVEITPSGAGLRIIGRVSPRSRQEYHLRKGTKRGFKDGDTGIEIYRHAKRYITISGNEIGDCQELPNIDALIDETVARYITNAGPDDHAALIKRLRDTQHEFCRDAANALTSLVAERDSACARVGGDGRRGDTSPAPRADAIRNVRP